MMFGGNEVFVLKKRSKLIDYNKVRYIMCCSMLNDVTNYDR